MFTNLDILGLIVSYSEICLKKKTIFRTGKSLMTGASTLKLSGMWSFKTGDLDIVVF